MPYLAMETIDKHTKVKEQEFLIAVEVVLKHLFVYDTISSTLDDPEAVATLNELLKFFES